MELENAELKSRVSKLERIKESEDYERAKYMEGAVWMGKKISNEIERVC